MDNLFHDLFGHSAVIQIVVSAFLATYMVVQGVTDKKRRRAFFQFALTWFYLSLIEFLTLTQALDSPQKYEFLRLTWGFAYAYSLMDLFQSRRLFRFTVMSFAALVSVGVWMNNWLATTSITFPFLFGVGAYLHGKHFLKHRGYASAVLCASSILLAMMCADYFFAYQISLQKGPQVMILGYLHYAVITVTSVAFGWIHFPRELKEKAPVRVKVSHALTLVGVMTVSEMVLIWDFLTVSTLSPLFIACMVVQLTSVFCLYFYHRNKLVIYAANVTDLLEKRTASLKEARNELSKHNEILADKLSEQEKELKTKAEVIERQRRLELAAQTAGEAAHDIQNSISPLLVHLKKIGELASSPNKVKEYAIKMRNQVEGLLDLNGQMLALSRRGRLELNPINLQELLESVSETCLGQDLKCRVLEEVWINGSWSQLQRAVMNLVSNAFESYDQEGGPVEISCKTVVFKDARQCHLGFLQPGQYGCVSVRDWGSGIPSHIIEQIFEPFYSSKNRSTRSGSGLGLSIVTAIVDDLGGIIDLETGQEGSCFTLYFPSVSVPGKKVYSDAELSGNETVLVIDDDITVTEELTEMLETCQYQVIVASNGPEAIKILQIQDVDLIISDFNMPEMNGLETLFAVLQLRPRTEIVVYSSYLSKEDTRRMSELRVESFLYKPASRKEILLTVRQILDRSVLKKQPRTIH